MCMVAEDGTIPSPQGIRSPESTRTQKRSNDNDLCEGDLGDVNVKGITDILKKMGECHRGIPSTGYILKVPYQWQRRYFEG
jgi:hypothetical protein